MLKDVLVDGLGASWDVGAPEDRFIRYYAWGKVRGVSVMGCGMVSVDGDVYLAVLRRSYVRTRTSTTPVWVGSVRISGVGASTVGDRHSYAWVAPGDCAGGLRYVSGAWLHQRSDTVAPTRGT